MITVYGIKHCDTVNRARQRLDEAGIDYRFHDFRVEGLDRARVQAWIDQLGLDGVLNRKGTTWRKLDPDTQAAFDTPRAAALLAEHSSAVKRPVFERGGALRVGFPAKAEAEVLEWLRG